MDLMVIVIAHSAPTSAHTYGIHACVRAPHIHTHICLQSLNASVRQAQADGSVGQIKLNGLQQDNFNIERHRLTAPEQAE